MRAREAKPRQVREIENCNTLFSWQTTRRTDRMLPVPFLGAVLPEPGCQTPRSFVKHPG